jgi:hypothetical protein
MCPCDWHDFPLRPQKYNISPVLHPVSAITLQFNPQQVGVPHFLPTGEADATSCAEDIFCDMQKRDRIRAYARQELTREGLLDEKAQDEDRLVCSFDEVRVVLEDAPPVPVPELGHTTVRMRYSCLTTGSGWSHTAEVIGRTRCRCECWFSTSLNYVVALAMEAWMRDLVPALARHLGEGGASGGAGRISCRRGA